MAAWPSAYDASFRSDITPQRSVKMLLGTTILGFVELTTALASPIKCRTGIAHGFPVENVLTSRDFCCLLPSPDLLGFVAGMHSLYFRCFRRSSFPLLPAIKQTWLSLLCTWFFQLNLSENSNRIEHGVAKSGNYALDAA
jgi:hypothetical protein